MKSLKQRCRRQRLLPFPSHSPTKALHSFLQTRKIILAHGHVNAQTAGPAHYLGGEDVHFAGAACVKVAGKGGGRVVRALGQAHHVPVNQVIRQVHAIPIAFG